MPLRHRVHAGTSLTNANQTLLTFSDNLVEGGAILWGCMIVNRDASAHKVTIFLVPSGGAAAIANCVYEESVPANTATAINGPFHENSNAFVVAISDAAAPNVSIRMTGSEEYIQ